MRSFDERKEEIFLRSEKRIAQRKKNIKRVVLACAPLVLCVTALSGYLVLGGFGGSDKSAPESAEPQWSLQDSAVESPECMPELAQEAISLQVTGGDRTMTYTQQQILDTFQCMLVVPPVAENDNAGSPESMDAPKQDGSCSAQGSADYILTLTFRDGWQDVFNITDGVLSGPYGAYELTDDQLLWIDSILNGEEAP